MYLPWLCLVVLLLARVKAFECPKGRGCSDCSINQMQYLISCNTSHDNIVNVEVVPYMSVFLECSSPVDWTKFNLGSSNLFDNIKELSFWGCNLPHGFSTIADQLLTNNLDELTFSNSRNDYMELINDHFHGLSSLKRLSLLRNKILNIPEDLMKYLPNLSHLDISYNNLRKLPKNVFNKAINLEVINLNGNKIKSFNSNTFDNLVHLKKLFISVNSLVKIKSNTFDKLYSLKEIHLNNNRLRTLPDNIFVHLGNLTDILLSENEFTINGLGTNLLRNCSHLRKISFRNNNVNMTTLPSKFFANMTELLMVRLDGNGLAYVPEDLFWGTINLQNINLGRNYLSTLPKRLFKDCRNLLNLNLKHNEFTYLPEDVFTNLDKLVILDLSMNKLKTISGNRLSGLTSLRKFYINSNELTDIHPNAFVSLQHLRIAIFSNNLLKFNWTKETSPFRSLKKLKELHLRYNPLTNLENIYDIVYSNKTVIRY